MKHDFTSVDRNTQAVLELAKSCSKEQLVFQPESGWNILQIFEHVWLTDKRIIDIMSQPSEAVAGSKEIFGDEKLKDFMVTQRSRRIEAPDALKPTGAAKDLSEFEDLFLKTRNALKEAVESGKIRMDDKLRKHRIFGDMTQRDWIYFLIHHTERHLEQIRDRLKEYGSRG